MAISETGTSTENKLGGEYQVFLSFRGPDTRYGFTNILYNALKDAGIHVFIDDEELRPGGIIRGNLLRAIDDSKVYIPIFSPNYASSPWCLRELAKMVENTSKSKDGNEKVILPIFYNVKSDDVKLKSGLYKNAILKLEQQMEDQRKRWFFGQRKKKFSPEEVESWRHALCKVGETKGWELEKYLGDGNLCNTIVDEVMDSLKIRQRKVTEDLVGMEYRLSEINKLLDIDSGGERFIGIYGMGGMGKTTLAKIIFNQLYPRFGKSCSFLDDVREMAKTKGLVTLQERLLSNISNSRVARNIVNSDDGMKAIEETICNKKVMIVLDDVDDCKQIQQLIGMGSLCPGTRILITTRDQSILKIRGFKYEIVPYEMEGLSDKDALQLFSRHAFNNDSPLANYCTLSEAIVSTAGGLPLALQAIGSLLFYEKKIDIWEEMLRKLRKTPHRDVQAKLRISYDALETNQKEIFLDVACFFIGRNKTEPIFVWDDCDFSPKLAINVLIRRCMIKVLDNNRFWMHDQFRDLGRAIAEKEHTRLWDRDVVTHELRSKEIKRSVQALCLQAEFGNTITIAAREIKRFPNLRFLWLSNVTCQGDFTGCLSKLKWIGVHYSNTFYSRLEPKHCQGFEATNLPIENLAVVKLSGREFTEEKVSSLTEGARKLKVLTLYRDPPEGNPREFD